MTYEKNTFVVKKIYRNHTPPGLLANINVFASLRVL